MTAHTQNIMIIVLSSFAFIVLVYAIFKSLDWYEIFTKHYGDNPLKGRIYVDAGGHEDFYDAIYTGNDELWLYYDYTIGKMNYTVAVPFSYDWIYVRGKRKICVDFGNEFAKPITEGDCEVAEKIKPQLGALVLNRSIDKQLAIKMVDHLNGRKSFSMLLIFIIIGVAIAGFVIYRSVTSKPASPDNPGITPAQTTTPPETLPPWEITPAQ